MDNSQNIIKTAVVGATGYAGAELLRLLSSHPNAQIKYAVSKTFGGREMGEIYPNFNEEKISLLESYEDIPKGGADVVFLCLPHGKSMEAAPGFINSGAVVIDLSGDFRYDDLSIYEKWYKIKHTEPILNAEAVYGLPEYRRFQIRGARFIANPGCYTTTGILALAPLLKEGLIAADDIIIDAKSGITGAGRKESLDYAYCETASNFKAYSVAKHRHTSEIEEQLSLISGKPVLLQFTPHLLPVKRGILETIYAKINPGVTESDIEDAYADAYGGEPFTHVLKTPHLPELKHVVGSNECRIGYVTDPRTGRIIIVSCTDNLLKGAAGQAVQNMNIVFNLPEDTGLKHVAWYL